MKPLSNLFNLEMDFLICCNLSIRRYQMKPNPRMAPKLMFVFRDPYANNCK